MPQKIQFRRGTAAQWTAANPVLAVGEMGLETDSNSFKIGNGLTAWTNLSYVTVNGNVPDGAITEAKLASSAVSATKIATDAVITAKIQNGAVTSAKLASGAAAGNLGFTPASTGKAIAMAIVFGG